jgi:hypothetical protein
MALSLNFVVVFSSRLSIISQHGSYVQLVVKHYAASWLGQV